MAFPVRIELADDIQIERPRPRLIERLGGRRACDGQGRAGGQRSAQRSEEHTSELQSLMRISYAVFCLKKKKKTKLLIRHYYTLCTYSHQHIFEYNSSNLN